MNTSRDSIGRVTAVAGSVKLSLMVAALVLSVGVRLPSGRSWAAVRGAASCSAADVNAAISSASDGDIVIVPSGSCSWGSGVNLNKSVTLRGSGIEETTITGGWVTVTAARATISDFTLYGAISVRSGARDFRIHHNKFNTSGESISVDKSYGLIDNNIFNVSGTGTEVIHVFGPDNSWSTDSSYGTADAVYIEDNTFNTTSGLGSTQCVQGNYNARFVFRYNTVTNMKVDAHGIWSNGTPSQYCNWGYYNIHSARHYEIYGNDFLVYPDDGTATYWFTIELRGGSGFVFDNKFTGSTRYSFDGWPRIALREYCLWVTDGNCCGSYLCPEDYPWRDQLGRGKGQASEPLYIWDYFENGTWRTVFVDDPGEGAQAACGPYDGEDIVREDRDYYQYKSNFDGSSGVGKGTYAQMLAISPTATGVGFWATDVGSWNESSVDGGLDGQLWRWNGSRWVLHYEPYTYPHPLRWPKAPSNPIIKPTN